MRRLSDIQKGKSRVISIGHLWLCWLVGSKDDYLRTYGGV